MATERRFDLDECVRLSQTIFSGSAGSVPSSIALHDRLEALDLRNNALDTIPAEWTNAATSLVAQAPLVYLRIAGNQFAVRICMQAEVALHTRLPMASKCWRLCKRMYAAAMSSLPLDVANALTMFCCASCCRAISHRHWRGCPSLLCWT
jgi:hypothetical protein